MANLRQQFKELVDRSTVLCIYKCRVCGVILAEIVHPKCLRLDKTSSEVDHYNKTGHASFTALKNLIIYMNQADKNLAAEIDRQHSERFKAYMQRFVQKSQMPLIPAAPSSVKTLLRSRQYEHSGHGETIKKHGVTITIFENNDVYVATPADIHALKYRRIFSDEEKPN